MKNELVPLYREMAAEGGNFHGLSIVQYSEMIAKLIRLYGATSVLDYGCGRADAYRSPHMLWRQWGLKWNNVHLYDPAFEQYAVPPRRADAVLSSDVLEHIPEEDVDRLIADLFLHARRFVWASVCCRPARKTFPGTDTNLHVTIRPFDWWHEKFTAIKPLYTGIPFHLVESP
jgi:hypothetical protein